MRAILGFAGAILLTGGFATLTATQVAAAPLEITVSESSAPGSAIGVVPGATGESPAAFDIAGDGCGVSFAIDPRSGQLTLANSPLDFEQQSRHTFTVRMRRPRGLDGARRAYLADLLSSGVEPVVIDELLFEVVEQPVIVHVTDAPEPPVLSAHPLTLVVQDPAGSATAPLSFVDPDSDDSHEFELIAGDQERFQIDSQTGVLTWRSGAAVGGAYPVTVQVTDGDGLSDTVTLNVEVIMPMTVAAAASPTPADVPAVTELPAPPQPVDDDLAAAGSILVEPLPGTIAGPIETPVTDPIEAQQAIVGDIVVTDDLPLEDVPPELDPEEAGPLATATNADVALALPTPAAATPSAASGRSPLMLMLWLAPLFMAAGITACLVLLRRRKRLAIGSETSTNVFRVVREARMLAPAQVTPQDETTDNAQNAHSPALQAEKAAVHELMASAFEQSSIQFAPPPPPAPVEPAIEARHLTPLEMLEEVYRAPDVADAIKASAPVELDTPEIVDEPVVAEFVTEEPTVPDAPVYDPLLDSPAFATQTIDMTQFRHPAFGVEEAPTPSVPFNELIATPTSQWGDLPEVEAEPGFDTEPFARPVLDIDSGDVAENGTEESTPQWQIAESDPAAEMSGYDMADDELGGGYHQVRLSATSFAPTPDEIAAAEAESSLEMGSDTANFAPDQAMAGYQQSPEPDDAKLQELRRQLSDLFGVSAERSTARLDSPADDIEQPEAYAAEDDVQEPEPVAPAPVAQVAEPEAPAAGDPSDPVNTWLAYLKQRSQDPSSPPKAVGAPDPAVIAPQPVAPKPVNPAPAPVPAAPVISAQVANRMNKTAVREEITLLRNVANLHSRNVLARRALHQRARFAWVLWGTALVVLCFGGLAALRQGPGLMRTVSMVLFAGAAVALGGSVHAFRSLNNRGEGAEDEEERPTTAEDFDRTLAPELMTAEMEARLQAVMNESPEVAVGAGEPRS